MGKLWTAIFAVFCLAGAAFAAKELDLLNPALRWQSTAVSGTTRTINAVPLNVSLKDFDLLAVRLRTSSSAVAELYWAPARNKFSLYRNYPFYADGQGKENFINLAAYTRDGETALNHFLLTVQGTAEITELKLVKSGPWQKAVAGWQEFFGPLSRLSDGLEFLVIRSPRLGGRSFIWLVNCLFFLLLSVVLLRGKRDLRRVFLVLLLAAWGLLELNSLRNSWLTVRRDARYLGQPPEVKRALINEGDFYAFLKFADRELPPGAGFGFVSPHPYYECRAAYYLYPKIYFEKGGRYLLAYDLPADKKDLGQYKLWKTFRPGAAIGKL